MLSRVLGVLAFQGIFAIPALLSRSRGARISWVVALLALNVVLAELAAVPQARALMDQIIASQDASGKIVDVGALYHKVVWNARMREAVELTQVWWLGLLALVPIRRPAQVGSRRNGFDDQKPSEGAG